MKKPTDGFCTNILFALGTILIFGGSFLKSLSKILKVNLNWLRVPTTYFSRKKIRTRRDNPNLNNFSWKSRKKPPKGHIKNRAFCFCKISKDWMCHIISPRVESSEEDIFDSDGSSVIVDNSENSHICSEKDMFTDKIDPIISNGLANIGGKYIIPKEIILD